MHTYRTLLICGATTLIGLVGAILLHGGWEAVAAALGMLAAIGSVLGVAIAGALGERPRSRYPDWANAAPRPRRAEVDPAPSGLQSGRAPAPASRPVTTTASA